MTAESRCIVVVEDEALLLFTIADDLRQAGFEVLEASDAREAIVHLERRADVELLFTDIDLPGSMDGVRLSAVVRERWPHIKIVVTSGKHRPDRRGMPEGSLFIGKPYLPGPLARTMHGLLP